MAINGSKQWVMLKVKEEAKGEQQAPLTKTNNNQQPTIVIYLVGDKADNTKVACTNVNLLWKGCGNMLKPTVLGDCLHFLMRSTHLCLARPMPDMQSLRIVFMKPA